MALFCFPLGRVHIPSVANTTATVERERCGQVAQARTAITVRALPSRLHRTRGSEVRSPGPAGRPCAQQPRPGLPRSPGEGGVLIIGPAGRGQLSARAAGTTPSRHAAAFQGHRPVPTRSTRARSFGAWPLFCRSCASTAQSSPEGLLPPGAPPLPLCPTPHPQALRPAPPRHDSSAAPFLFLIMNGTAPPHPTPRALRSPRRKW